VIRRLGRRRIHVVCAYVALVVLFGWLFGIAPSYFFVRMSKSQGKGSIPRSIILDVVFLDLLDVMIGLWVVHAFCT